MELQEVGARAAGEPVHENRPPEGPGGIKGFHVERGGEFEDPIDPSPGVEAHPDEVVVEVDVAEHPRRRAKVEGIVHYPASEPRSQANRPGVSGDEPVPIGHLVEHFHDDPARSQTRVDLGAPEGGLEVAHLGLSRPSEFGFGEPGHRPA
jgi:hypothetical protein